MPCGRWKDEYRTSILIVYLISHTHLPSSRALQAAFPWCEWWHSLLSVVNPRGKHSNKNSTCLDQNSSVQEKSLIFSFFKSTNLILCPLLPELGKCSIWGHLVSGSHVGPKHWGSWCTFHSFYHQDTFLYQPDSSFYILYFQCFYVMLGIYKLTVQ